MPAPGFPRGTLESDERSQRWTVEEIELNAAYSAADFATPAPMDGTQVTDNIRQTSYVAGNGNVPDWIEARRTEQMKQRTSAGATIPVAATPPNGNSGWIWSILLAAAGVISFAFAWRLKHA